MFCDSSQEPIKLGHSLGKKFFTAAVQPALWGKLREGALGKGLRQGCVESEQLAVPRAFAEAAGLFAERVHEPRGAFDLQTKLDVLRPALEGHD